jgi:hypothetical protein
MTPVERYLTCRRSAHRLETLQHYDVPDDEERQRAFHAGDSLPSPRPAKIQDLKVIASLCAAGRDIERTHIVDRPLSDYICYELAAYAENATAGEGVWISERDGDPGLAELTQDFVIFDAGTPDAAVVFFDYDVDGRVHRYWESTNPEVTASCWQQYQLARSVAVPLEEFTVTTHA